MISTIQQERGLWLFALQFYHWLRTVPSHSQRYEAQLAATSATMHYFRVRVPKNVPHTTPGNVQAAGSHSTYVRTVW